MREQTGATFRTRQGHRGTDAAACLLAGFAAISLVTLPDRGRAEAAEGIGVTEVQAVDLLPAKIGRGKVAAGLSRALGATIVLIEPDLGLLETLRWSYPDPERERCEAESAQWIQAIRDAGWVSAPSRSEEVFDALLEQAEKQVLFLEEAAALETLAQARAALPCAGHILSSARVVQLMLLEAICHLGLDDGDHAVALQAVVAVAPDHEPRPDISPEVRSALEEARKRAAAMTPRPVAVSGIEGMFYLDGRPLAEVTTLLPGPHLLQVSSTSGRVRSRLVDVNASTGASFHVAREVDLGLPTSIAVRRALSQALASNRLPPPLSSGLDACLESRGLDAMAFVVWREDRATVRVVRRGGTVSERLPRDSESGLSSRAGPEPPPDAVSASPETPRARISMLERMITVGVGVEMQSLTGGSSAFLANGRALGYDLYFNLHLRGVQVGIRAGFLPYVLENGDAGGPCPPPAGDVPSAAAVSCAAGELPVRALYHAGVGAGYAVSLGGKFYLLPAAYLDWAYLPNTLVQLDDYGADVGGVAVVDASVLGPTGSLRLGYMLVDGNLKIDAGLGVSAGAMMGLVERQTLMAIPLGFRAGLSAAF